MKMMDANANPATFSGFNALGQPNRIGFYNGVNTTLTYDTYTNRLTELSTTTPGDGKVQDFLYGYDNNGNILSITDNVESDRTQTFTYDWLNRLATTTGPYGAVNYNMDHVGNVANPPDTTSGAYRSDQTLVYDYENRLISVGGNTFTYDYQGARVKKNDDITYVSKLYEISSTEGITKHIFAGGRRIASITGSSIYYYHLDHLGSLSIATNASGNKVQEVTYYPYGEVRTNWCSGPDLPYKFTGHELDSETGLYYCGARYYDASQGRFLTPDTIVQSPGDPQTLNRYAYARNNPLAFVDPSGHDFWGSFCDFFISFGEALLAAFVGAVVGWFTNPVLGGMVAGAIMGAFSGNITNVVIGAETGGAMGALPGPIAMLGQAGMLGYSVARNGPNALAGFAAGFIGGMAGGVAGSAFGDCLNNAINSNIAQASYQSNMRDMDSNRLSYNQIKSLVAANNLSDLSDEMIIAMCWKESSFNPDAESDTSTATGLMGVTEGAANDTGYDYSKLSDPATNIQAGSSYLQLRVDWKDGDVFSGISGYGTGSSYATSILQAEAALQMNPQDPVATLQRILHK